MANALSPNQQFFYDNLHSFSHAPGQLPDLGRVETAIRLERAENDYLGAHRVADVRVEWHHDIESDSPYETSREFIALMHGERTLAALGDIVDCDEDDRRVYRAELAIEAQTQLRAIIDAARG